MVELCQPALLADLSHVSGVSFQLCMARTAPRQPGPPAGVIFGCNRSSEEESLNGLFGMSSGHWSLVKEIVPGTPCFLFNFNTKVPLLCQHALGDGVDKALKSIAAHKHLN